MRYGLTLIVALLGCSASDNRVEIDRFGRHYASECRELGIEATISKMGGCDIKLSNISEIAKLPTSGMVPISLTVTDCRVGREELRSLVNSRVLKTLMFSDCKFDALAIADMVSIKRLEKLSFTRISLGISGLPSRTVGNPASRLEIVDCEDEFTKLLLDQMGFSTKNEIKMSRNFELRLGKLAPHVDHLSIVGCNVSVSKDFMLSPNLFELISTRSTISGELINQTLRIKSLMYLEINDCEISDIELQEVSPPTSVNPRLIVQANGTLAKCLREKLPNGISINQ